MCCNRYKVITIQTMKHDVIESFDSFLSRSKHHVGIGLLNGTRSTQSSYRLPVTSQKIISELDRYRKPLRFQHTSSCHIYKY